MNQSVLQGMPARLWRCTPTKLTTWLDCPRRFRFAYLEKRPKARVWAHISMGNSVHNALRDWWSQPFEGRTAATAIDLVTHGWIEQGFRDEDQSTSWRRRAAEMTAEYVKTLDPGVEPVGVERTVSTTTEHLALTGRVDRIDAVLDDEGQRSLVIVDYKTGRRSPTEDDVRGSLALAVYAVCATRTLRAPCTQVELHHLPTSTVVGWSHTRETLARHLDRAEEIAAEAEAAETLWRGGDDRPELTPARPGPLCAWCDHRSVCPQGQAVSVDLEPWAGLRDD